MSTLYTPVKPRHWLSGWLFDTVTELAISWFFLVLILAMCIPYTLLLLVDWCFRMLDQE